MNSKYMVCLATLGLLPFFLYSDNSVIESVDSIEKKVGVVRVFKPGIFDYQGKDYIVRMRAWGVRFPERGQPGYEEAISLTEELLDRNLTIEVKREFDRNNLKVVEVLWGPDKRNFSRDCIGKGIGWHDEEETSRLGTFVISEAKAKRQEIGIWKYGENFQDLPFDKKLPAPFLRSIIEQNPFSSSINYWVTSFGKIHRPSCSFYQRGRGKLSRRPTGTDCRICGGVNPRKE